MIKFIVFIFLVSFKAHAYKACGGVMDLACEREKVESIKFQLKSSMGTNTDLVYMELLRQKAIETYQSFLDDKKLELEQMNGCYEYLEKMNDDFKCDINYSERLNYLNDLSRATRISLSLWKPENRKSVNSFTGVADDKITSNIEHLSFVSDLALEKANDAEKKEALRIYDINRSVFSKEHKYPEKFDKKTMGPVEIWRIQDGVRAYQKYNSKLYRKMYLSFILENPVLKHMGKAEPLWPDWEHSYKSMLAETEKNIEKIKKLDFDDLEKFLFFDKLVESVLEDNPFFCPNAESKRNEIQSNRATNEVILSSGGLVFCFAGMYATCGSSTLAGSVTNFYYSKKEMDMTLSLGAVPNMVSSHVLMQEMRDVGKSAGMVGLSIPLIASSRPVGAVLGMNQAATGIKNTVKSAFKITVKGEGLHLKKGLSRLVKKDVSKGDVPEIGKFGLFSPLGNFVKQADKVFLKKFNKQIEQAVKESDKKVLVQKEVSEGLKGTSSFLDNVIIFEGLFTAADYLSKLTESEHETLLRKLKSSRFDDSEVDLRFNKIRAFEKACSESESCNENIDDIVNNYTENVVLGERFFDAIESSFEQSTDPFSEVDLIQMNSRMHEYGRDIFPNYFKYYGQGFPYKKNPKNTSDSSDYIPDRKIPDSEKLKMDKILYFDIVRLRLGSDLKNGMIESYLKNNKNVSPEFSEVLNTSSVTKKILENEKDPIKRKRLMGIQINKWIEFQQELIYNSN